MQLWIGLLIIGLVLLIILLCYFKLYNNDIYFLNKSQVDTYLQLNSDSYYETFSQKDLEVRNASSVQDYLENIKDVGTYIPKHVQIRINNAIYNIKQNLKGKDNEYGVNFDILINTPWYIGAFKGSQYENGLPHTRGHVIMINENQFNTNNLEELLLHEKTHVYQKMKNPEFTQYIKDNYIKNTLKKNELNSRANPDVDKYIYTTKNGVKLDCKYKVNTNGFLDVDYTYNDSKYEHPWEYVAYKIEELI